MIVGELIKPLSVGAVLRRLRSTANFKLAVASCSLAVLLTSSPVAIAADPLHKCHINGAVSYQRDVCPSAAPHERPTVAQLNAERQKKLLQARESSPEVTGSGSTPVSARSRPALSSPSRPSFICDGRTHCSQMTSCAEAKYFLANCPNVKMDGDHDGVPCETQWCN